LLRIEDLTVDYQSNPIIKDLALKVDFPSIVTVLGNNGSGKSTFLNALTFKIPFSGQITINSTFINQQNAVDYFTFLGQSYQFYFPFVVQDFIRINHPTKSFDQLFEFLVSNLQIEAFLDRKLETLSQGQLQKCLIAQTLLQDSDVMLLDEPESFLDLKNRNILAQTLVNFKAATGKIIIVVTHDLDLVAKVADKILNFSEEQIALTDNSEERISYHKNILLNS